MNKIFCREKLEIEIHHHPHHKSLNEKLMDDLSKFCFISHKDNSHFTNIRGSQFNFTGNQLNLKPKGVILIEPNDQVSHRLNSFSKFLKKILNFYKFIKGKNFNKDCYSFEEVGNFIYTTNSRELEKFLLGMHYRHIGLIELNDHYIKGVEYIDYFDNLSSNLEEESMISTVSSSMNNDNDDKTPF